jgi:Fe-S-cluster containining protein
MALKEKYNTALEIISQMTDEELETVEKMCADIQAAQHRLLLTAEKNMEICMNQCEGLCCKNIVINDIIDMYDFIFILISDRDLTKVISKCLENENRFYSADCIFLKDGKGPCIFPWAAKPEICVTSFCGSEDGIGEGIGGVYKAFSKLEWYIALRTARHLKNFLMGFIRNKLKIFYKDEGGHAA